MSESRSSTIRVVMTLYIRYDSRSIANYLYATSRENDYHVRVIVQVVKFDICTRISGLILVLEALSTCYISAYTTISFSNFDKYRPEVAGDVISGVAENMSVWMSV